jgi:isoleucyl-tRNA synthetase
MPFIAEELYQNLILSMEPDAPISVHLAKWPEFDNSLIDEKLNREMALVMKLASLGHAARNKANRKVRQPLAEAAFSVGNKDEVHVLDTYAELLEDELNVKHVRALSTASEAVSYSLNPLPKQLGQKYGGRFPAIRKAILAMEVEPTARKLMAGETLAVTVEGEAIEILPEEVEVRVQAREGFAVASEGAYLAALETDLTPELEQEGLAREFVRRVQDLRKVAELEISDRIEVVYEASPKLSAAIKSFDEYIRNETLALALSESSVPEGLPTAEDKFDGETIKVGLKKAS